MRLIFFLLSFIPLIANAQKSVVDVLDSVKLQKLNPENITYINLSSDKKLDIEEASNVLVDFSAMEMSEHSPDSVEVIVNKKRAVLDGLYPFLIKDIDSNAKVSIRAFAKNDTLLFASNAKNKLELTIKRKHRPVFADDRIVFGVLAIVLALIFYTSHSGSERWQKFYRIVPALLLCYLIPAILDMFGLISKEYSGLYPMARDYLLPGALILMTLGIDFKGILNLGPKAIIMFLTATVGIIVGGPIAIFVYSLIDPEVVSGLGNEATWRGMATIAGSWIGGGANQNAMYETYKYAPELYGRMIVVDVVVANLWMAFLLWGAARADKFDRWLKADTSSIEDLKKRVVDYQSSISRIPVLTDLIVILGITFGIVAISHFAGKELAILCESALGKDSPFASSFFWLVVLATTGGLILSATKARKYEGAGASKIGSVFIYILVATIGMKMELMEAVKEPELILVGIIWMIVHVTILFIVAKIIKAPFFFVAVGSKANIGGAASAPIVAAAFHPSLASVGAILAVLGYALGTYGAILCAEMMRFMAP
jgi:uncharacterized membrane protein